MPLDALAAAAGGIWGTVAITAVMAAGRALRLVHLDFGRLLGEIFLPPGRAAVALGLAVHVVNGVLFGLLYAAIWAWMRFDPTPASGAVMGAVFAVYHWAIAFPLVGLAGMFHPRVKSGEVPDPGLFALRYGPAEPVGRLVGHIAYGAVFGAVYASGAGWWGVATGAVAAAALAALYLREIPPREEAPGFVSFMRPESVDTEHDVARAGERPDQ